MKKILTNLLLTIISVLTSTSALAHTGHLTTESLHSFIHVEHIVLLVMVGLVALSTYISRNK
jgi:hydrogenase/urease accessory protein HupE